METRKIEVEVPNELYTSNNGNIDKGFLCAKVIKHAFKTYPKVRIGRGTELQTEQPDDAAQPDDFYSMPGQAGQPVKQDPNPPYGNQPDISAGVTVDPADSNTDDGTF